MPNMKVFIDDALPEGCRVSLQSALLPIREMLCRELNVDKSACQFAILPVIAMSDLPRINVELMLLPKPERSHELVMEVSRKLQNMETEITGVHAAVRTAALDPETYVALK